VANGLMRADMVKEVVYIRTKEPESGLKSGERLVVWSVHPEPQATI
jgi:hypothetical protein